MTVPQPELWKYFVDVRIWPMRAKFDPQAWMQNFSSSEAPLAMRLLEGFTYYSNQLVEQMFRSAFANISQTVVGRKANYLSAKAEWSRFVNTLQVVRVTGEIPSDADSGYIFTRLTREILTIPESQICTPEEALARLMNSTKGGVLFVDDFVGSGNQFAETWAREYNVGGSTVSFKSLAANTRGSVGFFYIPVICTDSGRARINRDCPEVSIIPAHFMGSSHSALTSDSIIWRDDMRTEGPEFVRTASARAGIPDLDGGEGCWRGFHKLGLAIAFEHGCPDASLPLFTWEENDWKPLIRKGAL
jgi:hypothetical protein